MKRLLLGHLAVLALFMSAGISCDDRIPTTRVAPVPDTAPLPSVALKPLQGAIRAELRATPTPSLPALVGPDTPCQEWVPLAVSEGWPADREVIETLVSIIYRESRCNHDSYNPGDVNGGSRGLLQINGFWCEPRFPGDIGFLQSYGVLTTCEELFDPATNLHAGIIIYTYSAVKNQNGWHPWRV